MSNTEAKVTTSTRTSWSVEWECWGGDRRVLGSGDWSRVIRCGAAHWTASTAMVRGTRDEVIATLKRLASLVGELESFTLPVVTAEHDLTPLDRGRMYEFDQGALGLNYLVKPVLLQCRYRKFAGWEVMNVVPKSYPTWWAAGEPKTPADLLAAAARCWHLE